MVSMRRITFIFAALSLAGCSLFVGLDGLTGGDGGDTHGTDATAIDVVTSGDASTDALATLDSTFDAGVDALAPFCPHTGAVFCADFDDPDASAALLGPSWDDVEKGTGATLDVSTAESVSNPRALEIATGSTSTTSFVSKLFTAKHYVLSFDLYVVDYGGNNTSAFFNVSGTGGIYYQLASGGSDILESYPDGMGGTTYANTPGPGFPLNAWHHVDFEVDFANRFATVSVDGTQTIRRDFDSSAWTSTTVSGAGLGPVASSNAHLFFDDVYVVTF